MLSERQLKLLELIIKEYIATAEPVGSENLVSKYKLNISPATVRNEMVVLTEEGFLAKPHFSAGRIPTQLAFRHFIKYLMEEEPLPVVNEVAIKQKLWEKRKDVDELLRQSVRELAQETNQLALCFLHPERLYHGGYANILNHPEFYEIDLTQSILRLLEDSEVWRAILAQIDPAQDFGVLLSEELGLPHLEPCGLVFARIKPRRENEGHLLVLGPLRLNYPRIIPRVRYFQHLINELGQNL